MRTVAACDKYDSYACLCTLKLAVSSLANKKACFPFWRVLPLRTLGSRSPIFSTRSRARLQEGSIKALLHCRDTRQARQYNACCSPSSCSFNSKKGFTSQRTYCKPHEHRTIDIEYEEALFEVD